MLDQSIIVFEDLNDLLKTLDEYIELHQDALQRYGDRLGNLLRLSKGTTEQRSASGLTQQQSKDNYQKRKGTEKEVPWNVFKLDKDGNVNLRIANTAILPPHLGRECFVVQGHGVSKKRSFRALRRHER